MNKLDRIIVGLLVAALIAWSFIGRRFVPDPEAVPEPEEVVVAAERTPVRSDVVPLVADEGGVGLEAEDLPEAVVVTLRNAVFEVAFTSHGGGVSSIALLDFAAAVDRRDESVVLDFEGMPALRYAGLPGFASHSCFQHGAI
jgi:ABC-type nitrate/sulfonate/bicarbonate transport system permease component